MKSRGTRLFPSRALLSFAGVRRAVVRSGALSASLAIAIGSMVSVASLGSLAGCKKTAAMTREAEPTPTLVVRDDSSGLLLTWIDERGDFHVEQKVSDVPLVGRDAVRVVDPTKEDGAHAGSVVVADLRTARPDGTYSVRAMSRADFDALAIARRAKNNPTLANAAGPAGSEQPTGGPVMGPLGPGPLAPGQDPSPAPAQAAARPAVIIYGASWCSACHQAAAYLKQKNISFVEKDIEADAAADEEMRTKLHKAGLRGGSIPVIDVRGTVMVGFNPNKVEEALGRTL